MCRYAQKAPARVPACQRSPLFMWIVGASAWVRSATLVRERKRLSQTVTHAKPDAKLKAAGRKAFVIVAGYPDSVEQLKAAGVADFVHVRSNPIEVLTKWQGQLGVKK